MNYNNENGKINVPFMGSFPTKYIHSPMVMAGTDLNSYPIKDIPQATAFNPVIHEAPQLTFEQNVIVSSAQSPLNKFSFEKGQVSKEDQSQLRQIISSPISPFLDKVQSAQMIGRKYKLPPRISIPEFSVEYPVLQSASTEKISFNPFSAVTTGLPTYSSVVRPKTLPQHIPLPLTPPAPSNQQMVDKPKAVDIEAEARRRMYS